MARNYWWRLATSLLFLAGLISVQAVRITGGYRADPAGAAIQYVIGGAILLGVPAVIVFGYWVASRGARRRRALIETTPGLVWICDVKMDSELVLESNSDAAQGSRLPRSYALVFAGDELCFIAAPGGEPVARLDSRRVLQVTQPSSDQASAASEFVIRVHDHEPVELRLVNPILWGTYPTSSRQVQRVIERLRAALPERGATLP